MFYTADMDGRVVYREEPCKTALNRVRGMPFGWSLNPYAGCAHRCTFCYVRAFERRADRPSDDRYGTSIRVKVNLDHVLRRELTRTSWKRELVAIGAATDPYQPAEGRYRLTRGAIMALADNLTPFSIITRGPLIVRDTDVLVDAARRVELSVTFSIPTLDDAVWRTTEVATAPPRQRLRALSRLVDAGIKAGVGMAPLLPGLSDDADGIRDVVRAARDAGAAYIWSNLLYLRPGTREHFLGHLARDWPEMLPQYEALYRGRAYLGKREHQPIQQRVSELRQAYGIADRRRQPIRPPPARAEPPPPLQLELALALETLAYAPPAATV